MSVRLCLALALLAAAPVFAGEAKRGLDVYFIDTDGGAATLIVTPARESILIDCGNPGRRDAERIHQAAKKAGLEAIDHLIVTHWHLDHYGSVGDLVVSNGRVLTCSPEVPRFWRRNKIGAVDLIGPANLGHF